MKIKLLTRSSDLNKILISKLNQLGLSADAIIVVDYEQPLLPQLVDAEVVDNLGGSEILSESVSRADYILLHTPLTEQTKNIIGPKEFALMKQSSFLVNVARAAIVDRETLFTALYSNTV